MADLLNLANPYAKYYNSTLPSGGQVQGAQTSNISADSILNEYKNKSAAWQGVLNPTAPTGSTTSTGNTNTEGLPTQPIPEEPQFDFQSIIQPALDTLSEAEQNAQSFSQEQMGGIDKSGETQRARQQAYMSGEEKTAGLETQKHQAGSEDAMNQARKAYSEMSQGLQSRFGGTTGTGAFATELLGRSTMENIGKIRSGLQTAVSEINNRLAQVREVGNIALQEIDDKIAEQKMNIRQNLQQALDNIRNQRGALLSQKASLVQDVLNNYRNMVSQIEQNNQAFKQQIYLKQLDAENTLKAAQTKANQIGKNYSIEQFYPQVQQMSTFMGGKPVEWSYQAGEGGKMAGTYGTSDEDEVNY